MKSNKNKQKLNRIYVGAIERQSVAIIPKPAKTTSVLSGSGDYL